MTRTKARTDANHKEIIKTLRDLGCTVHDTSALGGGFPDLVADVRGRLILIEVKDGNKPKSQRRLTDAEVKFYYKFMNHIAIVESKDDVYKLLGIK